VRFTTESKWYMVAGELMVSAPARMVVVVVVTSSGTSTRDSTLRFASERWSQASLIAAVSSEQPSIK
jgi:hypothetical protein